MAKSASTSVLNVARESLAQPMEFSEVLSQLSLKDRTNIERWITALETDGSGVRAAQWRRFLSVLRTLAPHAIKFSGRQTVQFYVADGKYRMQIFALEDLQDGKITVYCPDVLEAAIKAGVVAKTADPGVYLIKGTKQTLQIESLDGAFQNPAAHYKDMIGWNRKALRVILPPDATAEQTEAVELLCAISARPFKAQAPASSV